MRRVGKHLSLAFLALIIIGGTAFGQSLRWSQYYDVLPTINPASTGAFGGEETDLITFSSDGSSATAEQGVVTGEVLQYTRFVATRTSGSCYVVCVLARQ